MSRSEEERGRQREAERSEAEAALKGMSKADLGRRVSAMREWDEEELRMLDRWDEGRGLIKELVSWGCCDCVRGAVIV